MTAWNEMVLPKLISLGADKRLPVVATLLLTLMIAQVLAVLTWKILPQPEMEDISSSAAIGATPVRRGVKDQNQILQISQWHLFGEEQKVAPTVVAKVTEAPDTRLNLKLLGVMASSDPALARAIIADGKGMEDAYAIGGNLPGNAVLREIYTDRVILEYRGKLEALRLPKEIIPSSDDARSNSIQSSRQGSRIDRQSSTAVVNANTSTETSALLRQYREALINDPQSLMDLVYATPVTDQVTGKLKGYRIRPGKEKELLGNFGLKSGDVVTGVNGVPLDNPIKALEIMRDLSTASSVLLDVERQGVMQTFSFQVD